MWLKPTEVFEEIDRLSMRGAYSNIETRLITIITERNIGGDGFAEMDAPCYHEIEQDEFTPEMADETNEFC